MSTQEQAATVIPDLRDVPLGEIPPLDEETLRRLTGHGERVPAMMFNSAI